MSKFLGARRAGQRQVLFCGLLGIILVLLGTPAAQAQPFGGWLVLSPGFPTTNEFIEIAHNPALNPTGAFTIEAWVSITNSTTGEDCRTIAGKGFLDAWWIGQCTVGGQSVLRSYLKGGGSSRTGGSIPRGVWTHVAVVFDGVQRLHYINGDLAATFPEAGPLTTNGDPVQIGSDVDWTRTPTGAIDEVNLWNVARTEAQIEQDLAGPITGPVQGLLAVWSFNGTARDSVAVYNGTIHGPIEFGAPAPPAGGWLTTSRIPNFRFKVRITAGAVITGVQEADCVPETLCVSGAVPGRSEVFLRIIGPRPNGFLWPNVVKFTTSQVEVWIEQLSTGEVQYYFLAGPWPGIDDLPGLYDRLGFLP